MEIEFNSAKDATNREKHGVSLAAAADMDFDAALVLTDERRDYGEPRFRAIGPIKDRLHVLVFTMRSNTLRAISLRKANPRERRGYEQAER